MEQGSKGNWKCLWCTTRMHLTPALLKLEGQASKQFQWAGIRENWEVVVRAVQKMISVWEINRKRFKRDEWMDMMRWNCWKILLQIAGLGEVAFQPRATITSQVDQSLDGRGGLFCFLCVFVLLPMCFRFVAYVFSVCWRILKSFQNLAPRWSMRNCFGPSRPTHVQYDEKCSKMERRWVEKVQRMFYIEHASNLSNVKPNHSSANWPFKRLHRGRARSSPEECQRCWRDNGKTSGQNGKTRKWQSWREKNKLYKIFNIPDGLKQEYK